jgi:uncharacterized protein YfeS
MRAISNLIGSVVASLVIATFAFAAPDTLSIVGTDDGMDILRALAVAFREENKSIWIDIPRSIESSGGISAVANDRAVLGRVARALTDAEVVTGIQYEPFCKASKRILRSSGYGCDLAYLGTVSGRLHRARDKLEQSRRQGFAHSCCAT